MRRRLLVILGLVALTAAVAGCEDDGEQLSAARFAPFEYGIRLSIDCRRTNVKLAALRAPHESPADLLRVASFWRAQAVKLDRDVGLEEYPSFLSVPAGDLLAQTDVLKNQLGTMTRALRSGESGRDEKVRAIARDVAVTGRRLRAAARALDANACMRVGIDAEERLLPALARWRERS